MSLSIVAGLGNPGREYDGTRHNLGFVVIDALAAKLRFSWKQQGSFEADVARGDREPGHTLILAKPLTYMNESGRSLRRLADYYRVPVESIIVLYDDFNIDLGRVKLSVTGSAGGHNGVASLLEHLSDGFIRYRLGIGPRQPPQIDLKDFVLGSFTPEQQTLVQNTLETYVSGLQLLLSQGIDRAMNSINRREPK
jgi:PTH1 family peptidyl-tRNA hydrolase